MATQSETVLGWLKAAGEESRLRLLALCARQELSVSDLADVLRQSEPRVSRHLKILLEAGLLERLRQGQWVHYRLTREAAAAGFVQGLLALVDRADPIFAGDRARAAVPGAVGPGESTSGKAGVGGRVDGAPLIAGGTGGQPRLGTDRLRGPSGVGRASESRLGRELKEFVETVEVDLSEGAGHGKGAVGWPGERSRALVVGVEHLEVLEMAAAAADECVVIAHSRRAMQSARAFAERLGLRCRVLLAASSSALCEKDIEAAGAPFAVVFVDHLAVPDCSLEDLLVYGRRAIVPEGRLWLFERYESLERSRDKVVEHPIGRLRRMLGEVGLTCERLSPIEADGEHVLAAVAVATRETSRGAGAAGAA